MSAEPLFQTFILGREKDIVLVSFEDEILHTNYAGIEFRTPTDLKKSLVSSGHSLLNTVPVAFIGEEKRFPHGSSSKFHRETRSSLRTKLTSGTSKEALSQQRST